MSREEHVALQIKTATDALLSKRVVSWSGIEMAIRDKPGRKPVFKDPAAPMLQLVRLRVELEGGTALDIGTYENADEYGLEAVEAKVGPIDASAYTGIFRFRQLSELPSGAITGVESSLSDIGNLVELEIGIDGGVVILVAGEVYETGARGALTFCRGDESVLVFTSRADVDGISWTV